jgi:hypothetical protein
MGDTHGPETASRIEMAPARNEHAISATRKMEGTKKKRCWMSIQQRLLSRALSASIVSSFSTCKFGASELRVV